MCIAIIKPAGVDSPDTATLKRCFQNNPDGAGFLVLRGGVLRIHKGFMKWPDFEQAWTEYGARADELAGIHFRITTAGGTRPQNCHPFPLSQNEKDLEAVSTKTEEAMIHNGIFGSGQGKLSDTMLFIRDHLADPFIRRGLWTSERCRGYIDRLVRGSRVAVFRKDGSFHKWGEWIEDSGVFYSNTGYTAAYSRYGSFFYASDYLDDPDDPHGMDALRRWERDYDARRASYARKPTPRRSSRLITATPALTTYDNNGKVTHYAKTITLPKCPECGSVNCQYRRDQKVWECGCGTWFEWGYPGPGLTMYVGSPQVCPSCGASGKDKQVEWDTRSHAWECNACGVTWDKNGFAINRT